MGPPEKMAILGCQTPQNPPRAPPEPPRGPGGQKMAEMHLVQSIINN